MSAIQRNIIVGLLFQIATVQLHAAAIPTNITLTISPRSTVAAGSVVTLSAAVADPDAVTKGTVLFCDATLSRCDPNNGLYGSAQLTNSGTASIRTRFAVGVNNVKAVFVPTITHAGSTSLVGVLNISADPIYTSFTTLTSTGAPDNYNLIGTVSGFGSQSLIGNVGLLDISNGNAQFGTASLGRPAWTLAPAMTTSPVFVSAGLPIAITVGDFNGDGKLDLTMVNDDDNGMIAILLGNGDGTFQPPITYSTGIDPVSVAANDFNGDGKLDLAVANSNSNNVAILLGNGDGTFQVPIVAATGIGPSSIAVGDFNADGQLDLAITNANNNNLSILLGNGDGTFQPQVVYLVGDDPQSIRVSDFNRDGNLDLVTVNSWSNNLSVLLGNGDGTFQAATDYATGFSPVQVAVGDFNHDGNADLVTANAYTNDISLLMGNGDGSFRPQMSYVTDSSPESVSVADFNGDGNLDIVTASIADGGALSIFLGAGDGTFQTAVKYAANSGPNSLDSVVVGDFNGDGEVDLASAFDASVRILLGEQVATFGLNGINLPSTGPQNVVAVYSGDGSRSGSQSNIVTLTGLTASTITLTSSQPSLVVGRSALLKASVTSGASGLVSFTAGSIPLGIVTIDSSGAAVLSTRFDGLAAGSYVVTASYLGSSTFAASSASITETLSLVNSSVSLSSSLDPSTYGRMVTFTSASTPGATGTITFMDGTAVLGIKTMDGGVAALSISSLSAGSHAIVAVYSGDGSYAGSTSQTVIQVVIKAPTNLTLTSSADPSVYGSNVILTAAVTPVSNGTVTFADGTTILGIANLDGSGKATISTAALSAGTHNITAMYSGDANHF
jgi:Bacterial Ig-like domain (group 3)/FG-GAP-like repeat